MNRILLVLAALLLVTGITVAQAADQRRPTVRAFAVTDVEQPSMVVKDIYDPSNPYKGQYSAWDIWIYEHYSFHTTPENYVDFQLMLGEAQGHKADDPNRIIQAYGVVDENGYLVPSVVHLTKGSDQPGDVTLGDHLQHLQTPYTQARQPGFWAVGKATPELLVAKNVEFDQVIAKQYPAIPDWVVAQNRPTVLLPDGGALFLSDSRWDADGLAGPNMVVTRYDASGSLLKEVVVSSYSDWRRTLYDPGDIRNDYFKKYEHKQPTGEVFTSNNVMIAGPYLVYRGDTPGTAVAVVDYWQGRVLTANDKLEELPLFQFPYFQEVEPSQIARIYQTQQSLLQ